MNKITKKKVGSNFSFKQIMILRQSMFKYYINNEPFNPPYKNKYNFEKRYNHFRKEIKKTNYLYNKGELHRI